MRASTFRIFVLLLLKIDIVCSVIYNISYDITNTTVTPDFPVTWFPPGAWTADNNGLDDGGSSRATEAQGATMNFTFNGTAVYLIGWKAPICGLFSVIIDNNPPQTRNINTSAYLPQQVLFSQDGLSPGIHTFLANQSSVAGSRLSLDEIKITQDAPNPPPSPSGTPSNSPASSTTPGSGTGKSESTTQNNTGAIIGGVVAGVVALAALGVALFVWLRFYKAQPGEGDDVRLVAYAPARPWEPPLNSVITPAPHMDYNPGPSASYAPSFGTFGQFESPGAAAPRAPIVEKPASVPPPYTDI